MITVLEALRTTAASLADDDRPFLYADWCHCLCGHVARAVMGETAQSRVYRTEDPLYAATLLSIINANGVELVASNGSVDALPLSLSNAVSDRTELEGEGEPGDEAERWVSLELVHMAIAAETRHAPVLVA